MINLITNSRFFFCRYRSEAERNEHSITHWTSLPYKCDTCRFTAFSSCEIEKHFESSHSNFSLNILNNGPLVAKELKIADTLHMNEVKDEVNVILLPSCSNSEKEASKEIKITEVVVPENAIPVIHISEDQQMDPVQDPLQGDIVDNLDEIINMKKKPDNTEDTLEVC